MKISDLILILKSFEDAEKEVFVFVEKDRIGTSRIGEMCAIDSVCENGGAQINISIDSEQ